MRRREFMAGLVGAATTLPMHARSETAAAKVFCVGLLSPGALIVDNPESGAAFLQAMKERGYLRGQNLVVEARAASGRIGDLPKLAAELVAAKVDVILTNGFPTALASKCLRRLVQCHLVGDHRLAPSRRAGSRVEGRENGHVHGDDQLRVMPWMGTLRAGPVDVPVQDEITVVAARERLRRSS